MKYLWVLLLCLIPTMMHGQVSVECPSFPCTVTVTQAPPPPPPPPPPVCPSPGVIVNNTCTCPPPNSVVAGVCTSPPPTPVSVTLAPTSGTMVSSTTRQYTATVTGATDTSVTWTSTVGTVSSLGLFTAPTVASNVSGTVTARSVADSTKSASASITITPVLALPIMKVTPINQDFGAPAVGAVSPILLYTVTAVNGPVTTTNAVGVANDSGTTPGWTYGGKGTCSDGVPITVAIPCTISIKYRAAALGKVSNTLTINSNASNTPVVVTMTAGSTVVPHAVVLNWNASLGLKRGARTAPPVILGTVKPKHDPRRGPDEPTNTGIPDKKTVVEVGGKRKASLITYNVYRSTTNGTGYLAINSSPITTLSYTDTDVVSGTTYFYVCTAVNASNPVGKQESTFSNQATVVIP